MISAFWTNLWFVVGHAEPGYYLIICQEAYFCFIPEALNRAAGECVGGVIRKTQAGIVRDDVEVGQRANEEREREHEVTLDINRIGVWYQPMGIPCIVPKGMRARRWTGRAVTLAGSGCAGMTT